MNNKSTFFIAAAAVLVLAVLIGYSTLPKNEAAPKCAQTEAAETPLPADTSGVGKVVINELAEKNRTLIADSFGDFSDWTELKNISSETVSLSAWTLGDGDSEWTFPDIELRPGELLLVFNSGRDSSEGELHTSFAVNGKETLTLKDASGHAADSVKCQECSADITLIRQADGTFTQTKYATPGFENTADGYEQYQQTLCTAGALSINEVMVSNEAVFGDTRHGWQDWVEIKNVSSDTVELSDYFLSDSHKDYFEWQLPQRTLAPGEVILILCDGRDDRQDSLPGTNFSLNSENEQLFLSSSSGVIDRVFLRDIPYEGSFGRMDGENGWFFFASPTPGKDNANGERTIAASPSALTKGGIYEGVESVTVELEGAGTIRYTLDGSAPDGKSPIYSAPITLTKTTVLRAVSYPDGALPSLPMTETYIINEHHTLPVLSLATDDPVDFYGMYNGMQKGVEKRASLSLYEPDGGGFTIGCGVSLNGETSLVLPKKNMSVRFRGSYGSETLNYDIYGGGVTEFTNLLLRSGQDYDRTIVRNELCQALCEAATDNVINQRSIWCVLYINGEYKGLYTLKEKANEQLYASVAGVSRDSVELVDAPAPFESELNQEVLRYCIMNDMSLQENYDHICDRVDIDSLIDWVIMEGFCANVDLTAGNLRYVRSSENDNKWRFMFYDLDSTFTTDSGGYGNLMSEFAYSNRQVACLTYRLIENDEYKDRFLRRAGELFSTVLTNEAVIEELDRQYAVIAPEAERDLRRMGRTVDDWMHNREELVHFITSGETSTDWRQRCIDSLSDIFDLTGAERETYFGEIDAK